MTWEVITGDCLEVMRGMGDVDAVVTDPPYGIDAGNMNLGFSQSSRVKSSDWDKTVPHDAIAILSRLEDPVVIWGGNYFHLPPRRCFLVWDKMGSFSGRSFSECEMAWTNSDAPARVLHRDPLGCGDYKNRQHKTQKPVAVMAWCVEMFTSPGDTILDPFCGSGTTGVACIRTGRNFVGIEISEEYADIARRRCTEAERQGDLFVKQPVQKPEQMEIK